MNYLTYMPNVESTNLCLIISNIGLSELKEICKFDVHFLYISIRGRQWSICSMSINIVDLKYTL